VAGVELFVDFEPDPDRYPGEEGESQNEGFAFGGQVEEEMEMQHFARLVGCLEGDGGQEDVG